jgi:hypothetical protein
MCQSGCRAEVSAWCYIDSAPAIARLLAADLAPHSLQCGEDHSRYKRTDASRGDATEPRLFEFNRQTRLTVALDEISRAR